MSELPLASSDTGALSPMLSCLDASTEEAGITSPVSFSAISEMSPVEASVELIQSSEVTQTVSPPAAFTSTTEQQGQRRLKVCHKPGISQSQVRTYNKHDIAKHGNQGMKRKLSVTGGGAAVGSQFKTSKRTKKYLEKPFTDPDMERTRLNAINAKKNRDRKKQELQALSEQCDTLYEENRELDRANRSLEARLNAAEEEIAFLRRALLGRVGSGRPTLGDALKFLPGGDSAPAGVCGLGGKDI